jgi:4-hydroxybenzoate polyprenyltransferase
MRDIALITPRFVMSSIEPTSSRAPNRAEPGERGETASLGGTLYRVLCYTPVLFGLQGIARTLTAIVFLGIEPDPAVLGFAFTMPVLVYGHDRLLDVGAGDARPAASARTRWIGQHSRALRILVGCAGAASALFIAARPRALGLLAVMMGLALTYTVRWLPGRRSPKQLPGFKTPYVTAIWTALAVAVPLTVAGGPWDARSALLAIAMSLITGPYSIINDIYDIDDDRQQGTRSLAVILGERGARLAACLMCSMGAVISAVGLHSAGLALAGCYSALYCSYASSRRGPDHGPSVLLYRASSVLMLLFVSVLR